MSRTCSEDEQVERWSRIKKLTPSVLNVGQAIFVSVTSASSSNDADHR
jgi:hypothetical protein